MSTRVETAAVLVTRLSCDSRCREDTPRVDSPASRNTHASVRPARPSDRLIGHGFASRAVLAANTSSIAGRLSTGIIAHASAKTATRRRRDQHLDPALQAFAGDRGVFENDSGRARRGEVRSSPPAGGRVEARQPEARSASGRQVAASSYAADLPSGKAFQKADALCEGASTPRHADIPSCALVAVAASDLEPAIERYDGLPLADRPSARRSARRRRGRRDRPRRARGTVARGAGDPGDPNGVPDRDKARAASPRRLHRRTRPAPATPPAGLCRNPRGRPAREAGEIRRRAGAPLYDPRRLALAMFRFGTSTATSARLEEGDEETDSARTTAPSVFNSGRREDRMSGGARNGADSASPKACPRRTAASSCSNAWRAPALKNDRVAPRLALRAWRSGLERHLGSIEEKLAVRRASEPGRRSTTVRAARALGRSGVAHAARHGKCATPPLREKARGARRRRSVDRPLLTCCTATGGQLGTPGATPAARRRGAGDPWNSRCSWRRRKLANFAAATRRRPAPPRR